MNRIKLGRSICAETKAYIDAMSVKPSPAEIIMLDKCMRLIKDCGALGWLDGLYFLLGGVEQDTRINAKNPGTYNLTKINSPRFTVNGGWDANTNAGYLDTGFNPATAAGKFQQNKSCLGVGVLTAVAANPTIGNTGSGNSFVTPRSASDTFVGRMSSLGSSNVANTSIGLFTTSRATSALNRLFKNSGQVLSTAIASTTMASANIGILSDNSGSRYAAGMIVAFAFFGGSLTGGQVLQMYKAYQLYCAFYGVASA